MVAQRTAVLLLAHGSPDSPSDIPEFMRHITGGRPVSDHILMEVTHRYSVVGKSPLTTITRAQAGMLQQRIGCPVHVGMRNWRPFIADAVREIAASGTERLIAICLAPQDSSTSVGLYRKALMSEIKPGIAVHFVESWHDHPLLVQAFAEKLAPVWQSACAELGARVPVIFTAHSVPTRTIDAGDQYEVQAKNTARLVAESVPGLSPELRRFAFQSQGMSGGPWLGPTMERAMLQVKAEGHGGVVVAPIGFVCDHVEVLYDIDIAARDFAQEQGLRLWRAESLNVSPTFIAALSDLALSRLGAAGGQQT